MAAGRKHGREKHRIGAALRRMQGFSESMCSGTEAKAWIVRTPVKDFMRTRGGQVQPVRAEPRRERRISGDQDDEIADPPYMQQVLRQLCATRLVPRAHNDKTAAR